MHFVNDNIEFLDPSYRSVIFVHCFSQKLDTKLSFCLPDDVSVACIAFGVLCYNKSVFNIFFLQNIHSTNLDQMQHLITRTLLRIFLFLWKTFLYDWSHLLLPSSSFLLFIFLWGLDRRVWYFDPSSMKLLASFPQFSKLTPLITHPAPLKHACSPTPSNKYHFCPVAWKNYILPKSPEIPGLGSFFCPGQVLYQCADQYKS